MNVYVIQQQLDGVNFGMLVTCTIICCMIAYAVMAKKNKTGTQKHFLHFVSFFGLSMIADGMTYILQGKSSFISLDWVITIISYTASVLAAYYFYIYIKRYYSEELPADQYDLGDLFIRVYLILVVLTYASSIWTHWFFNISPEGNFEYGPMFFMAAVLVSPLMIFTIYRILRNYYTDHKKKTIIHASYSILYFVFGLVDGVFGASTHYVAMTASIALMYILVELENDRLLANKEKELLTSELNALRLHLNPHFIFNTLGSIDVLCMVDPNKAREMNRYLITYLRSTYLKNSSMEIPIDEELKNLEAYVAIEEIRFPDVIVRFDIHSEDFMIPPLVLQPIVENAIKHGIREKEDGEGTITISTYETADAYHVKVADDGVGFDTSTIGQKTDRIHIGVSNTVKRLELLCQGTMTIESQVGVGTTVTISIPKKRNGIYQMMS